MKKQVPKYRSYPGLLLLFISLVLCSCEKNNEQHTDSDGEASAKINGQTWEGIVRSSDRGGKFSVFLEKYGPSEAQQSIGIHLIKEKIDSLQRVYPTDSILSTAPQSATKVYGSFGTTQASNGDVGCDRFSIIEQDSIHNWIRIDQQKSKFEEVSGRFNLKLYRVEGCNSSPYPDTLHITEGKFYFKR